MDYERQPPVSIQFRLGNNDHKPVEDFLSRQHAGTGAIVLDAKAARHQVGAAEAARRAGVGVYWEPATERLASAGYGVEKYPMWAGQPYDLDALATSSKERGALVELLLSTQPSLVTHVTAPHFYVTDQRSAHLNIALAEMTRLSTIQPVRAVLTIANKFGLASAADLAKEYAAAGIQAIEIRLSPLGGDDESLRKIRDAYAIVRLFKDAGLHVTSAVRATSDRLP